ncbi:hypothetical protein [Paenibacillus alkalitolerans]|nr:hypothetical protein [Paenibacillus alkalitolerans]
MKHAKWLIAGLVAGLIAAGWFIYLNNAHDSYDPYAGMSIIPA